MTGRENARTESERQTIANEAAREEPKRESMMEKSETWTTARRERKVSSFER